MHNLDWEEQNHVQLLLHKEYRENHSGVPVTVQFSTPRIAWHFGAVYESKEDYEYSDDLLLKDEKDDIVAAATLSSPFSYKYHHAAVNYVPWTPLNKNTDLWGYRIKEVSKQEVKDSFMFSEEEDSYDSEEFGSNTEQRHWRVDVEINVKR